MNETQTLLLFLVGLIAALSLYSLYRSPPMPGAHLSTPREWVADMVCSGVWLCGNLVLLAVMVFFASFTTRVFIAWLQKIL